MRDQTQEDAAVWYLLALAWYTHMGWAFRSVDGLGVGARDPNGSMVYTRWDAVWEGLEPLMHT